MLQVDEAHSCAIRLFVQHQVPAYVELSFFLCFSSFLSAAISSTSVSTRLMVISASHSSGTVSSVCSVCLGPGHWCIVPLFHLLCVGVLGGLAVVVAVVGLQLVQSRY